MAFLLTGGASAFIAAYFVAVYSQLPSNSLVVNFLAPIAAELPFIVIVIGCHVRTLLCIIVHIIINCVN